MKKIVVLASGSGSNAENIVNYFKNDSNVEISAFITNNPDAFVIERANKLGVECKIFNRDAFYKTGEVFRFLTEGGFDLIVLAGFLWLVPEDIVAHFPNRIINIHPALLPKYGGKGMYGDNVHKAVVANKEQESGITIHFINEKYDEGEYVFQTKCVVEPSDSYEDVAAKIHALEYKYFPEVIKQVIEI